MPSACSGCSAVPADETGAITTFLPQTAMPQHCRRAVTLSWYGLDMAEAHRATRNGNRGTLAVLGGELGHCRFLGRSRAKARRLRSRGPLPGSVAGRYDPAVHSR